LRAIRKFPCGTNTAEIDIVRVWLTMRDDLPPLKAAVESGSETNFEKAVGERPGTSGRKHFRHAGATSGFSPRAGGRTEGAG